MALEGFFTKYGRWPTRICISEARVKEVCQKLLTKEGLEIVKAKLDFVAVNQEVYRAEGNQGEAFQYGESFAEAFSLESGADDWLGNPPLQHQEGEDFSS